MKIHKCRVEKNIYRKKQRGKYLTTGYFIRIVHNRKVYSMWALVCLEAARDALEMLREQIAEDEAAV